jgi:cellulose synthase/poly-beta-1,6-N-acetylglucosamine synthase-like glycosyltransferase
MYFLQISAIIILLMYCGLLCYLLMGVLLPVRRKNGTINKSELPPGVSIVIPFRNEAHNLEKLLCSLEAQQYTGTIEIVLVNDSSTDNFKEVLASRIWKQPLKVIDSAFSNDRRLTHKQQAADLGIKNAAYDWIACTDADMVLEPHWLNALIQQALSGADLVFGHTVIMPGKTPGLFRWFQKFQLETLFAIAYAFNRAGLTGSCMGNNMLLSRTAYLKSGGFEATGYSIVEDLAILASFRRKNMRTAATEPFSATAGTSPQTTINHYFHQLSRWVYGGFRSNATLLFSGALLGVQNILLWLACAGLLPGGFLLLTCGNLLLTWLFIAVTFRKIASNEGTFLFLPFYILFCIESMVLTAFILCKKPLLWKDRRIA